MVFGLFRKKELEVSMHATSSSEKPTVFHEASINTWCRENKASSDIAKSFFDLIDKGMPLFTTDDEAVVWLTEHGEFDTSVAALLGLMYVEGLCVPQSDTEAVKWFRMAAEQGNSEAQLNLGLIYEEGEDVDHSYSEAVKWFRMAAEQGDSSAQFNLGLMYEEGRGVEQSDSEAVKWFRMSAEQGNPMAQFNLGT